MASDSPGNPIKIKGKEMVEEKIPELWEWAEYY
jgi:hypothetical protein